MLKFPNQLSHRNQIIQHKWCDMFQNKSPLNSLKSGINQHNLNYFEKNWYLFLPKIPKNVEKFRKKANYLQRIFQKRHNAHKLTVHTINVRRENCQSDSTVTSIAYDVQMYACIRCVISNVRRQSVSQSDIHSWWNQ